MSFSWPQMLWLSLTLPLIVAFYFFLLHRKKQVALKYADLSVVKQAMTGGQKWRRHVPALLLLFAIAALLLSLARPVASVMLPVQQRTIILAMDVSASMRAKDVEPSRIEAAQTAAKTFVADIPSGTRVGIVTFADTAAVVQAPTENRDALIAAIDRFQMQRGTAIGSGIILSVVTLFPEMQVDLSSVVAFPLPTGAFNQTQSRAYQPVPPGSYANAAIVLLTDGQSTSGAPPLGAAKMAADRGLRVYTVGIGTTKGETIALEQGGTWHATLDEPTLKGIAEMTHGEYFYAGTATDLKKVYETLSTRLVYDKKDMEVTALFSAAAASLALFAAALSLLWFNRVL